MAALHVDAGDGFVLSKSWTRWLRLPSGMHACRSVRAVSLLERLPKGAWMYLQAVLPFVAYLMLFQNNTKIRSGLGLDKLTPPNVVILPAVEYSIFHGLPHRLMARFAHPTLDILAAVPYLVHFVLPFAYTAYLLMHRSRRSRLCTFWWLFGWTNLSAVLFQTLLPTAPPWYADTMAIAPDGSITAGTKEAAFARVDAMIGLPFFHTIYTSSPLQFGAFPSLHCAWPMTVLVSGPWLGRAAGIGHVLWIALAAVYSNHHYAIDCIAGVTLVIMLDYLFQNAMSPYVWYERKAALSASSSRRESSDDGHGEDKLRDEEAALGWREG